MSTGYQPPREQMTAVVVAARELFRVTRRWREHSRLPGYPAERGNSTAVEALFRLERALNPRCLGWGRPGRKELHVECWPTPVADGIAWLRNLLDLILERNGLRSLATATDYATWAREGQSTPVLVSIQEDELAALRVVLGLLPRLGVLPEADRAAPTQTPTSGAPWPSSETPDSVPVILLGARLGPLVLGRRKERLTSAQFQVVSALIEAGERGLGKANLSRVGGDAVNVLKRLAKSDPGWGAVIELPGQKGSGYRIRQPVLAEKEAEGRDAGHLARGPMLAIDGAGA